ncbi:MAG: Hsp20/alpha crystallin family protein [Candidatus Njordarchaeia archaeon]|nr:Hsp20/alpha crystallin family protein [Candidatus Korarchaeota archaeon]
MADKRKRRKPKDFDEFMNDVFQTFSEVMNRMFRELGINNKNLNRAFIESFDPIRSKNQELEIESTIIPKNENEMLIVLNLAGVKRESINIDSSENQLKINAIVGMKKLEKTFMIPFKVDKNKIKTELKHGILTILVKK